MRIFFLYKKYTVFLGLLLLLPSVSFGAVFDRDLYAGISSDTDVTRLQEFLTAQGVYEGPITGGFFSLTKSGVERFQAREGIAPVAGYFGPKTRGRANELMNIPVMAVDTAATIIFLTERILELNRQVLVLQDQLAREQVTDMPEVDAPQEPQDPVIEDATPPEEIATSTEDHGMVEEEVTFDGISVSGMNDTIFPVAYMSPLKIGDITLKNGTADPVLIVQIVVDITDSMNSTLNRGKEIQLLLRDGLTLEDPLISKRPFTFNSNVPPPNAPHKYQRGLTYSTTLEPGEERTISLWVELLEYVISGELSFEFEELLTTTTIDVDGTFKFTFSRQ